MTIRAADSTAIAKVPDGSQLREHPHFTAPSSPQAADDNRTADIPWRRGTAPLDLNGPDDRPFIPFGDADVELPLGVLLNRLHARLGDGIAIDDGTQQLSHRDILNLAHRIAQRLARNTPERSVIALALEPSASLLVAMLACCLAGRPAVPLDLHYPAERCRDIIRESGAAAILLNAENATAQAILDTGVACIDLQDIKDTPDQDPASFHGAEAAPDEPALILYTSGSTGKPKGIVNSRRNLLRRVQHYINAAHLDHTDQFLSLSTLCTIAGFREALTGLLSGGTVHILDFPRAGVAGALARLRDGAITVFNCVPAVLRSLAQSPMAQDAFHAARIIRTGGEALFWTDIDQLRRILPAGAHILVAYSSTEASGVQWFVTDRPAGAGGVVPIGHVLPDIDYALIDQAGSPAAMGQIGHLMLRGVNLALGQWQDGQCVPGRLRQDPQHPASRIFDTGDLMRMQPNGMLELLGRADSQLKIRGVRLEPAEVEGCIRSVPAVLDTAVFAQPDSAGQTELLACIVPAPGAPVTLLDDVRARLTATLPSAMRPTQLYTLQAIPRLPSGKVDFAALARLAAQCRATAEPALPPQGIVPGLSIPRHLQWAVQRAWRRCLGKAATDADLTFEAAGGNSLKMLELVYDIEQGLGRFTFLPLDLFHSGMRASDMARSIAATRGRSSLRPVVEPHDLLAKVHLMPGLGGDEPILAMFRAGLSEAIDFRTMQYPAWQDMAMKPDYGFEDLIDRAMAWLQDESDGDATPLRLAGYSFGGHVAFAAALRLQAQGSALHSLCLLDTPAILPRGDRPLLAQVAGTDVVFQSLKEQRPQDAMGMLIADRLSRHAMAPARRFLVGRPAQAMGRLLPARLRFTTSMWLDSLLRASMVRDWQASHERPVLDAPVFLFRAAEQQDDRRDLGWARFCSRLTIIDVPGTHHSMFQAHQRATISDRFLAVQQG